LNKLFARSAAFAVLPLTLVLGAYDEDDDPMGAQEPVTIVQTAQEAGTFSTLLADPTALASVLTYHVVAGAFAASDVLAASSLHTVNGAEASISLDGEDNPRIDDAFIIATDIRAKNGIVHVIDRVIFPG